MVKLEIANQQKGDEAKMESILIDNGLFQAKLARLTFGAGELNDESRREEYYALLNAYYADYGGRSFDTAQMYGNGKSEQVLGEWLRDRSIARDSVFITTKGGFPPADDMHACRIDRTDLVARPCRQPACIRARLFRPVSAAPRL